LFFWILLVCYNFAWSFAYGASFLDLNPAVEATEAKGMPATGPRRVDMLTQAYCAHSVVKNRERLVFHFVIIYISGHVKLQINLEVLIRYQKTGETHV
jgi:hypothetical protein